MDLRAARKLQPLQRHVLTAREYLDSLQQRQRQSTRNVAASNLVYRNYWWQIVEGPGLIQETHRFDDGSGPDPEFDFLTVSLMGWNAFFEESNGNPAPFPQWRMLCNVGEIPESRDYFISVGFLDEEYANGAPGKPWNALIQIGFYGWKAAT